MAGTDGVLDRKDRSRQSAGHQRRADSRQGGEPLDMAAVNAYVCTIGVANIDESIKQAQTAKATPAVPKMAIPGVGWLCYFKDTEGNIFGMMQNDPAAK